MAKEQSGLSIDGLIDKANAALEELGTLGGDDGFSRRTIHYYIRERLLPRVSHGRGPKTTYPEEFVDRLLMIRRLQREQGLALSDIRHVMGSVDEKTLRRVARGKESIRIRKPGERDSKPRPGERIIALNEQAVVEPNSMETTASAAAPADETTETFQVGSTARLEIRQSLTALQRKRIQQLLVLLESFLQDD